MDQDDTLDTRDRTTRSGWRDMPIGWSIEQNIALRKLQLRRKESDFDEALLASLRRIAHRANDIPDLTPEGRIARGILKLAEHLRDIPK